MKIARCLLICLICNYLFQTSTSETNILYGTKAATSDLDWTLHPSSGGWEELSGLDLDGNAIRYHQVCNSELPDQNNWARSPFIETRSAKRVYIDIEFSVMKCDECRETFTLYYYPSNTHVASTTFPPWKETPFVKIDTVAAGSRFEFADASPQGINKKTLAIGPLNRSGLYIAVQDQGACMSLMSMKLYYHYCPETTFNLAYFPKTVAGGELASLIQVDGKCVSNAIYANNEVPKYWCNSNGEWKVPSGSCHCRAGYEPNSDLSACQACRAGFYKSKSGNTPCKKCPSHSTATTVAALGCPCQVGFYRAQTESIDQPCSRPPSKPLNLKYKWEKQNLHLLWSSPADSGLRNDLYYSIGCRTCDDAYRECRDCPSSVQFVPADPSHVTVTSATLMNIKSSSHFVITVSSYNGVSPPNRAPASSVVRVSKSESIPSKVSAVQLLHKEQSSLLLKWSELDSDRITDYQVKAETVLSSDQAITEPIVLTVLSSNATLGGLQPGTSYRVQVRGRSAAGYGQFSDPVTFSTSSASITNEEQSADSEGLITIIVVCCAVGLLVAIVLALMFRWRRKKKRETTLIKSKYRDDSQLRLIGQDKLNNAITGTNARKTYVDYRDPHQGVKEIACEIDPGRILIERVIGQGEFGEVCRGKLMEAKSHSVVAIKRLRQGANLVDHSNFLREACTMAQFHDPNIVQFYGVVTKQMPAMIVSEFMENGSLDRYLQSKKDELTMLRLLDMLKGIASGMRYLSSMKYVHRDLAARNILVDSDLVCKVSDFGLSRNLENDPHATYTTQGGKIALRWTAPECIRHRVFTSASDVWSYGIVMWEVMSYGEKPYWEMSNDEVTQVIEDGYRLPAPTNCPQALHNLMLRCWSYEERRRPSFHEIILQIDSFIQHPDLLENQVEMIDLSAPLLSPDSPTSLQDVNTLDEWLDLVKLGRYRNSFYDRGIKDLETLAHVTTSDLERLGIASPEHRSRLQSGLDTLRRHFNAPQVATATPSVTSTLRLPVELPHPHLNPPTSFPLPPTQETRQKRVPRDVALV